MGIGQGRTGQADEGGTDDDYDRSIRENFVLCVHA